MSNGSQVSEASMITISYEDLIAAFTSPSSSSSSFPLLLKVKQAYGYNGLGILAITGVPDLDNKRLSLLPLVAKFASLPEEIKKKTETPHAFYQIGWSRGNEFLGDKPDFAKGSYYANPLFDNPSADAELIKKFPSFLEPNVWPTADLPDLELAFKELGSLIVNVGVMVARMCDEYVESECEGYTRGRLYKVLKESKCCKGRLLHYYPSDEVDAMIDCGDENENENGEDGRNSCGWHNDHGSLTGLVPAIHINKESEIVPNPDPSSGLYILSRQGKLVQAKAPPVPNSCFFQLGETSQIMSGGILQATPHSVRSASGPNSNGISRDTFAVFMEPEHDGDLALPLGKTVKDVQSGAAVEVLPKTVKSLASRWSEGMDFGQFSEATFSTFYGEGEE